MSDEFVGVLTKNKAALETLEQELCVVSFLFENPTVIQEAESREEVQEKKRQKKNETIRTKKNKGLAQD